MSDTVKKWKKCAKQVQLYQQQCGRGGPAVQAKKANNVSTPVGCTANLGLAELRQLVNIKVPQQLASACCGPLETEQHAGGCEAAAAMLAGFLAAVPSPANPTVQEGISQQIQLAELLVQLPALFAAAQRMLDKQTVVKALAAFGSSINSSGSSSSTTSSSAAGAAAATEADRDGSISVVLALSCSLVEIISGLLSLGGPHLSNYLELSPAVPAAVSLAVAVLRHLKHALQHSAASRCALLPRATRLLYFLRSEPLNSCKGMRRLAPAVKAAALGVLTIVTAQTQQMRLLLMQAPADTAGSSSATAEWCWEVANQPFDTLITLPNASCSRVIKPSQYILPPHLEQLMGCDNRTLRWLAAAVLADMDSSGQPKPVSCVGVLSKAMLKPSQPPVSKDQQQERLISELNLQLTSLPVLLAAGDFLDPAELSGTYWVLGSAYSAIAKYKDSCLPAAGQGPGQGYVQGPPPSAAAVQALLSWVEDTLGSLLVIMDGLTQQLVSTEPASPAAGDSSAASAAPRTASGRTQNLRTGRGSTEQAGLSGSSSSGGIGVITPFATLKVAMELMELLLMSTVVVGQPTPAAWRAFYKPLCTVLEGVVRAMAAATAAASAAAAAAAAAGAASTAATRHAQTLAETIHAAETVARVVAFLCNAEGGGVLPQVAATAAGGNSSSSREKDDPLLLFSLQCSLLKLSSSLAPYQRSSSDPATGNSTSRVTAVGTAAAMLASVSVASALMLGPYTGRIAVAAVACSVPWLVLFGRCCLQLADALPHHISNGSGLGVQLPGGLSLPFSQVSVLGTVVNCVPTFAEWLDETSNQVTLVGAGYSAELVVQLAAALRASELLAAKEGQFDDPTTLLAELKKAGTSLSVLALPQCCNNPSCSNVSKQTELQLVAARSCKCSQCRVAHYCSRECQAQHWKQHKAVCKALAAASASAAAVTASAGGTA